MKLIDYLKIILHSFYSKKLYKYIFNSWNGNILIYYFILSIIICLPICAEKLFFCSQIDIEAIVNQQDSLTGINKEIRTLIDQFPALEFDKDEMQTVDGETHKILNSNGDVTIFFDPTLKARGNLDNQQMQAPVIFAKYGVFWSKESFMEYGSLPYFKAGIVNIDSQDLLNLLLGLKDTLWHFGLIYALIVTLIIIISSVFYVAVYSLAIRIFYQLRFIKISYPQLFVLIAISNTPAILLQSILHLTILYKFSALLSFLPLLLTLAYALFALQNIKKSSN